MRREGKWRKGRESRRQNGRESRREREARGKTPFAVPTLRAGDDLCANAVANVLIRCQDFN